MKKFYLFISICWLAFINAFGQTPCQITLISAVGSDSQTVCTNTPITDITYLFSGTSVNVSNLPSGVTGTYNGNIFTISGIPNIYEYRIYYLSTNGCSPQASVHGEIHSEQATINETYNLFSNNKQVVCSSYLDGTINDITYQIGGNATGATVSTLPIGLSGSYDNLFKTFTITGHQPLQGTHSYTVSPIGTCIQNSEVFTITKTNPKSAFVANYNLSSAPTTVNFINNSTGANTYKWSFGDGNFSNALDSNNTYTTNDKYEVELIVSDSSICPDTSICSIFLDPDHYFSKYTTTYDTLQNNFILNVDPLSTSKAVSYKWDFGDGTTSKLSSPTHTFTKDSVYNVCMKIYTATGDSCIYCHQIGKDASGNIYRTAGFTLGVTHLTAITEIENSEMAFTVSPNPTSGLVKVIFNKFINNTGIKLYSSTGEKVFEQNNINSNQFTIDIANQALGIYILEVNQNGFISRTKLIKQ